jgi:predicted ATPase
MTIPNYEPLEYSVQLKPQGVAYLIDKETLSQKRKTYPGPFLHIDSHGIHGIEVRYFETDQAKLVRPNWEHKPLETSLAQVPKMFQEPEEFRSKLASSTFYHVLMSLPGLRCGFRSFSNLQPYRAPTVRNWYRAYTISAKRNVIVSMLLRIRSVLHSAFSSVSTSLRWPPVRLRLLGARRDFRSRFKCISSPRGR